MQQTIYIVIFAHENGTDFIRAICDDVIQLGNRLERLLPDFNSDDQEKFFNTLDAYKLISREIGNGTYHIYETSMNSDISIFLLHG